MRGGWAPGPLRGENGRALHVSGAQTLTPRQAWSLQAGHAGPQSGSHGRRATATTILAAVEAARPRRDRSVGRPRIPQARAADFNDGGVASHRRAGRLQGIGGKGYSSGAVFSFEYISEYLFCAACFVEYLVEYLF